jgi:diguanylate cyclase (GGDEF)-like protein/PAS domain S-box-containing protein
MSTRWIPAGLRPRLMLLIAFLMGSSTALMILQAVQQRDAAIGAAASEAALMSRLAAASAERAVEFSPRLTKVLTGFEAARAADPVGTRRRLERLLAYVGGEVETDWQVGKAPRSRIPESTTFLVVDRAGVVVARHPPFGARASDSMMTAPRAAGQWLQRIRGGEGHAHIVAFAPLPGVDPPSLYVGVSLDRDAIVAEATRTFGRSLRMLLLIGLLVSCVAWFGVQAAVVRRVEALLAATDRLRAGDLGARTGLPYGRGELSRLARAFDGMAAELQHVIAVRDRAEARLLASEAHKSAVLEASLDGLLVLDRDGVVLQWNAAARRLFGYHGRGSAPRLANHFFPGLALATAGAEGALARPIETIGRRLDGSEFPVEVGVTRIGDHLSSGQLVITVRDLTDRKRWERSIEALTLVDDLTGLYNRRGFTMFAAQQIRLAARTGQHVVIVSVDVDGLKAINDAFGHAEGDRAIVETAALLRRCFREADVIARFGGDEFVVLATETETHGAELALERLAESMALRNAAGGQAWPLGASFGWERVDPRTAPPLSDLLELADARMYEAKRARRTGTGRGPGPAPASRRRAAPELRRAG